MLDLADGDASHRAPTLGTTNRTNHDDGAAHGGVPEVRRRSFSDRRRNLHREAGRHRGTGPFVSPAAWRVAIAFRDAALRSAAGRAWTVTARMFAAYPGHYRA